MALVIPLDLFGPVPEELVAMYLRQQAELSGLREGLIHKTYAAFVILDPLRKLEGDQHGVSLPT